MKFSGTERNAIIIALSELLASCHVEPSKYLRIDAESENKFLSSLEDGLTKKLEKSLDDGGITSYVSRFVLTRFHLLGLRFPEFEEGRESECSVPLASYQLLSNILSIARDIAEDLAAVPKQYEIYLEALSCKSGTWPADMDIQISDKLRLVSFEKIRDKVILSHPNFDLNEMYNSFGTKDIKLTLSTRNSAYFVYRCSGLLSDENTPKIVNDAYDDIRAFYGCAFAFGLIGEDVVIFGQRRYPLIVNEIVDGERQFAYCEYTDSDIKDVNDCLPGKGIWEDGASADKISDVLSPIRTMFTCAEAQRLETSAIWLLRSLSAERGMDKILDVTISIEVLLGDREASDRIGLSKLMANRCAYSLGKSFEERRELQDFFVQFYKLRSEVVHTGRFKVSRDESAVISKGSLLAARIFRHEVGLQ